MLWILLALTAAFANAAYFVTSKKFLRNIHPYELAAGGYLGAGIFLMLISIGNGIPDLGSDLWPSLTVTVTINIFSTILIFKSLRSSDLSISIPMLSFTPVFLILTSFLILGEIPSKVAAIGILVIVSGSFILTMTGNRGTIRDTFAALFRSPGSRYMLIVAFLFSIALNFDRRVLAASDPFFAGGITLLMLGLVFLGLTSVRYIPAVIDDQSHVLIEQNCQEKKNPRSFGSLTPFLVIAILLSLESIAIYTALLTQIVPCVIAIKRMSILFTVMYGVFVLHEHAPLQKILGSSCMIAGAVLIAFSS